MSTETVHELWLALIPELTTRCCLCNVYLYTVLETPEATAATKQEIIYWLAKASQFHPLTVDFWSAATPHLRIQFDLEQLEVRSDVRSRRRNSFSIFSTFTFRMPKFQPSKICCTCSRKVSTFQPATWSWRQRPIDASTLQVMLHTAAI